MAREAGIFQKLMPQKARVGFALGRQACRLPGIHASAEVENSFKSLFFEELCGFAASSADGTIHENGPVPVESGGFLHEIRGIEVKHQSSGQRTGSGYFCWRPDIEHRFLRHTFHFFKKSLRCQILACGREGRKPHDQ